MGLFETFCDSTSLHGFKDFNDAKRLAFKIFWAVLVVCSFVVTCYEILQVCKDFRDNPTMTKVQYAQLAEYKFPNLAICPLNWVNVSKLKQLPLSESAIFYSAGLLYNIQYNSMAATVNLSEASREFFAYLSTNNWSLNDYYLYIMNDPDQQIAFHKTPMPGQPAPTYGKQYASFGRFCHVMRFGMVDSTSLIFLPYKFSVVYNDSTENSSTDNLTGIFTDKSYGVATNPTFFGTADETVKSDLDNIQLKPNTVYAVKVEMSINVRIPTRTYQCVTDQALAKNPFYSKSFCQLNCINQKLLDNSTINCLMFAWSYKARDRKWTTTINNNETNKRMANNKICSYLDGSLTYGVFDVIQKSPEAYGLLWNASKSCLCPSTCTTYLYEFTYSLELLEHQQKQRGRYAIEVTFNPVSGIVYTEEAESYTWNTLFSNIGGQFGLWMGGSILSIVQVAYFLGLCCLEKKETTKRTIPTESRSSAATEMSASKSSAKILYKF